MQETVKRYFKIFIGVIGSLISGALNIASLKNGSAAGLDRASALVGNVYHVAAQPSQFWFIIFFRSRPMPTGGGERLRGRRRPLEMIAARSRS
jgi:hypothetical protein